MDKLFYELIRVSTGQLDCLSRGAEPEEWQELYEMAHQQQLTGICYRGAQALFEFGLRVPHELIIDWMAEAEQIEEHNGLLYRRCVEVQEQLLAKGVKSSVLAGQGIACDYGEQLQFLRQSDGIDLLLDGSQEDLQALMEKGSGEEVRLHDVIGMGKNPVKNWMLRRWFEKNRRALFVKDGELTRPSASMNVVYLIVTLYWRFMYERITLQELMDCFFALKRVSAHKKASTINYQKILRGLGLLHFARGIMWVMHEAFGLEPEAQIVEPSESKGSFILQEVMTGKRNFFHLILKYPVEMLFSFF